ncbi:UV-damage endonuclease [Oceanobacillus limi]|uniref:UV-damage endonuclease n=1 Tax=Oceanobacillus limi TaxID=930131 RepID=A0A1I0G9F2_9BACI|nr:UV DNA damage repair endonuclease UvsE [Oceanobacillus limi]SET67373.1 UV-damage endonuclease [Oceanobacillus limi]
MTLVRLGYSAISVNVKNSSTSKTMTYSRFSQISDWDAAVHKLEQIAKANLSNCLRLFKYNVANDINFYRISSKLIPLADHPETEDWDYMDSLKESLTELASFLKAHPQKRVDFHADHFVLLNSPKSDVLKNSVKTLRMHYRLLKGLGVLPRHRCVMHVGGGYGDKEQALEQFVHNWGVIPTKLQEMIILENDDKTFSLLDTLYLCEKLGIPLVFDYHHHLANHDEPNWSNQWDRIVHTWSTSSMPIKMHISSPRSSEKYRAHADYVDPEMFLDFLNEIKGTVPKIDCMIEAKQKDDAIFRLIRDLRNYPEIEVVDQASFLIK